jgi:hypothetical protein
VTKITLYMASTPQEYHDVHDVNVSAAGILTFCYTVEEGSPSHYYSVEKNSPSGKPRKLKCVTSVPFLVEEEVVVSLDSPDQGTNRCPNS